jgi:transcriptional regulator with XRE-family HTH domain
VSVQVESDEISLADAVDAHVGKRMRLLRNLLGISQEKLAATIGISFQQVQKYEIGINRVRAGRLYELAMIMGVPITFFFEEFKNPQDSINSAMNIPPEDLDENERIVRRETLELVRAYYRIENEKLRRRVFELMKTLS